ncbi:hypothetical protein [Microtetraspora malaysiensis]
MKPTVQTAKGKPSPWLPPGTPSTWICPNGHINPRTTTTCGGCKK